jgi:acetyl-CoA carboxylase carboxyl transferase subunit beta
MNWLTKSVLPKIKAFVNKEKSIQNLWIKCNSCNQMIFEKDLKKNLNICSMCNFHMPYYPQERLKNLFDENKFEQIDYSTENQDILGFKDLKRYSDRLKASKKKTEQDDCVLLAKGKIGSFPVVIAAFDFRFMGGSMGRSVGNAFIKGANIAVDQKCAFITIPSSGGARMQEGIISLMQMPRTIAALQIIEDAKLPHIVILTNPTTGGVTASFAMLGDVHIAEPGATIGFAGKRVIEETVKENLPENFQTSEYLLEHGMIDIVADRKQHRKILSNILNITLSNKN